MALIGTLTSGISALKSFSKGLEVIGNNIANVNTTGYKSSSASFADTFSNTLRSGSAMAAGVQVGTGVQLGSINTNFTQGALAGTGKATDLGVSGNGYFVVQDASGKQFATRDGAFHFVANTTTPTSGDLVNAQGYNVLDKNGAAVTVANYSTSASVNIGSDGTVTAYAADGTATVGSQIGLQKIPDESRLLKQGDNLYDFAATGAVPLSTTAGVPNSTGLGLIRSSSLELSNVDLTDQFADLITTQRSFQAGSRLVTVSDSVLEDIVNLKRS
jgi:flagellar hook protein FlgE